MKKSGFYRGCGKRVFDVSAAYILLLFLYIPMAIIGLLVTLTSRGGAIFRQKRVGKDGRVFILYKFRTMRKGAPELSHAEFKNASEYVTPLGRFLRRTSLDELPQLFNVLNGDMSLVGARPLILSETKMHDERREKGIYLDRPGITGLAQSEGRDLLSDSEKLALEVRYHAEIGFLEDVRIIARTLGLDKGRKM
ncbi:MAG: sugar transferase [Ruminococcaceae bacterium]|nr:sugar transferase [Oscillospiraceae bacterium]